jgi:hypothetical protein
MGATSGRESRAPIKTCARSRRAAPARAASCGEVFDPVASAVTGAASYPAAAMAVARSAIDTAPETAVTRARSVARFTCAPLTPGTCFSARSTRPTQDPQVMPATDRSKVSLATV